MRGVQDGAVRDVGLFVAGALIGLAVALLVRLAPMRRRPQETRRGRQEILAAWLRRHPAWAAVIYGGCVATPVVVLGWGVSSVLVGVGVVLGIVVAAMWLGARSRILAAASSWDARMNRRVTLGVIIAAATAGMALGWLTIYLIDR
jgi:hypothetical protein